MKRNAPRNTLDAAALNTLRQLDNGVDPRSLSRDDIAWLCRNEYVRITTVEDESADFVGGRSHFNPRAIVREVATILPAGRAAL